MVLRDAADPYSQRNETMNPNTVLKRPETLRVSFRTMLGGRTDAVRGVSFNLRRGKTLALVGESGSGKSVTSYSILRLIQKPGEITGGKNPLLSPIRRDHRHPLVAPKIRAALQNPRRKDQHDLSGTDDRPLTRAYRSAISSAKRFCSIANARKRDAEIRA